MAKTYRQQQVENLKVHEQRLLGELRQMAEAVGVEVQRFAVGATPSQRVIPPSRAVRERLNQSIWEKVLRPYYIGSGDEPYNEQPFSLKPRVNSAYARTIFDGVEKGIALEADRQIKLVEKYASADPVVLDWLTGSRPIGEQGGPRETPWYDPFHKFVYRRKGGGEYILSDAIWDTAAESRETIDKLLAYYIADGTAAVDIAEVLIPYLTDGTQTRKPYGQVGSYSARRLARTEITAAAGRAYVNAAAVNPFISGTRWNLSPSHPKKDICDTYAGKVYQLNDLPGYPAHPHCLCYLTPVTVARPSEVVLALRAEIDALQQEVGLSARDARAIRRVIQADYFNILRVQGAFNRSWMATALTYGEWLTKVMGVSA